MVDPARPAMEAKLADMLGLELDYVPKRAPGYGGHVVPLGARARFGLAPLTPHEVAQALRLGVPTERVLMAARAVAAAGLDTTDVLVDDLRVALRGIGLW